MIISNYINKHVLGLIVRMVFQRKVYLHNLSYDGESDVLMNDSSSYFTMSSV